MQMQCKAIQHPAQGSLHSHRGRVGLRVLLKDTLAVRAGN